VINKRKSQIFRSIDYVILVTFLLYSAVGDQGS